MSEHITHIAVFEDIGRLVLESRSDFPEAFSESLKSQWDAGLLAAASRGNHLYSVPILEQYRDAWASRPEDGSAEMHVAASLGWMCHRAADLQMKPISWAYEARLESNPRPLGDIDVSAREYQVYQDAVTFREVYDGGLVQPGTPYHPVSPATLAFDMEPHPAANSVDVRQVEPLLAAQIQDDLLLAQGFTESEKDLQAWIDTFSGRLQKFTEDLDVYITAFAPPNDRHQEQAIKMVHYIDEVNWYNAEDGIIRWARALQRDLPRPSEIPVTGAVTAGRTQSQYAQALSRGYDYVVAAAAFWNTEIGKEAMYDAFENFNPNHRI